MKKVVIYTTGLCPFCLLAKRLFTEKDVSYQEVDVLMDPRARADMVEKSGGRTIFMLWSRKGVWMVFWA